MSEFDVTTQSTMNDQELFTATKQTINILVKANNFEKLETYLESVLNRPYGMRILSKLAVKRNGLDDFARTQIKVKMPEAWWTTIENRLGSDAVTNLGGTKRKSVKKTRKRIK
jgi:hypothetical protein